MFIFEKRNTIFLKTQISILGSGWLGLDLTKHLMTQGFIVKASTTTALKLGSLNNLGVKPYLISLKEDKVEGNYSGFLEGSETLIINIPPGLRRKTAKNHVKEIQHFISCIEGSSVKKVIYISSVSVFKNENDIPVIKHKTEVNAETNNGRQLIEIEKLLLNNPHFETVILRLGGLFDEKRHPAKILSGRSNIKNSEAPINLIHKEDIIGIISALLKLKISDIALNAVYPKHPKKHEYYTSYCKQHNLPLPIFDFSEISKGKKIDSSQLEQLLNYTFKKAP